MTSVVIAAYNESKRVKGVVEAVRARGYDVIVVDDGSKDDTAKQARAGGARVLRHPINRGQGAALRTGIDDAVAQGAKIIVTYDADGQFLPEEIDTVVAPIEAGDADVVLGSRYLTRKAVNISVQKQLAHTLGRIWTWLFSGRWYSDPQCGFRAFNRGAATRIRITLDRFTHASEILDEIATRKLRVAEVPVTVIYHERGQSSLAAITIGIRMLTRKVLQW